MHTNVFWGVLAAPVRLINVLVRLVRVARFTVVVLEVREPAGGRERGRLRVVPTVPLFHYFSIVRGPGRCADGRFVTVQEGRGGHLRVCRPILYLYIPSWAVWTSWDRNYRPHARLRSHNNQMIVYIEKSQTVLTIVDLMVPRL